MEMYESEKQAEHALKLAIQALGETSCSEQATLAIVLHLKLMYEEQKRHNLYTEGNK